jgi:hypothetical protein
MLELLYPRQVTVEDPRVRLHVEDGRFSFRRRQTATTSSRPNRRPHSPASLGFRDFFQVVRQRLNEAASSPTGWCTT